MMKRKAIETITGYGATLRSRLKAAMMSQTALARATGLSRQTVSSALADRVSATTVRLIDDVLRKLPARGSVESQPELGTAINLLPLRSRSDVWATATHIDEWARRREAQEELPRLIRLLILLSSPNATAVSFRAAEGVQLPGVDGRVESERASAFTPAGTSVWELGTGADPSAKATADFAKRIPAGSETFVFVTARRWSGKESWAEERRKTKKWRDVRAYDADDIETWLEQAPSVHLWFSTRIGIAPRECVDLEYWWHNWQRATNPRLGPAFLLSGREDAAKEIVKRLAERKSVFAVQSESQDESIAVLAAALEQAPAIDRDEVFARCVVVFEQSAWRHLAPTRTPLILIPLFDVTDVIAAATEGGHTVVLPLGAGHPEQSESADLIEVPAVSREPAVEFLKTIGGVLRDSEWELASLARRSMTAFRRHIAVASALRRPTWADPVIARAVIPALFLGSWNDDREGDRLALTTLSQAPYDDLVARFSACTNTPDPLLRRRGSLWYLVSPVDAWRQLGRHVTADLLGRFSTLALEVFSTLDPRLDLAQDKQWMAGMLLPKAAYSNALRRGIAATIALLGSRADALQPGQGNDLLLGYADRLVQELLERARAEPRLWASFADHLPDLAEAAPDVFLGELERALNDPARPMSVLFADSDKALLFAPSSPHVDVLWALERLAWSRDHLARVIRVLGLLDAVDPGGKTVNRPKATLRTIFQPWLPQTSATTEQRIKVLAAWAAQDGNAAWDTLLTMLPEVHGIGHYSARPQWREWYPEKSVSVSRDDYWRNVRFAASTLLALAGNDGLRWKDIVEALPRFPETEHDAALSQLTVIDQVVFSDEGRLAIWNALRELVAQHRNFSDATWAMPADRVERIDAVRVLFEPTDVVKRHIWLFSWRPAFPDASPGVAEPDYKDVLQDRQVDAARAIYQEAGLPGLIAVAQGAQNPRALGIAVAKLGALDEEPTFLKENLGHADRSCDELAYYYIIGRANALGPHEGHAWLVEKYHEVASEWAPLQRALLLVATRHTPEVWEMASTDAAVAAEYWMRMSTMSVDDTYIAEAASQLILYKQPFRAIELLGHHISHLSFAPTLLLGALEAATFGESADKPDQMFTYYVERLLDFISDREDADELRIGRLEWALLPVMSHHQRTPRMLKRAFLRDPSLFVEAITWIYKGENDPPHDESSVDDGLRDRASRAYELLRSMRTIPGSRDDGSVDGETMRSWVERAREMLAERDRVGIGTHEIGQLLGASPLRGEDGAWPLVPVRDLVEVLRSEEFDRGVLIGHYNSRGVTTRSMTTGGAPERSLAKSYVHFADVTSSTWPRTATLLRMIARGYLEDARRHDHDVAIREDMGV